MVTTQSLHDIATEARQNIEKRNEKLSIRRGEELIQQLPQRLEFWAKQGHFDYMLDIEHCYLDENRWQYYSNDIGSQMVLDWCYQNKLHVCRLEDKIMIRWDCT